MKIYCLIDSDLRCFAAREELSTLKLIYIGGKYNQHELVIEQIAKGLDLSFINLAGVDQNSFIKIMEAEGYEVTLNQEVKDANQS